MSLMKQEKILVMTCFTVDKMQQVGYERFFAFSTIDSAMNFCRDFLADPANSHKNCYLFKGYEPITPAIINHDLAVA